MRTHEPCISFCMGLQSSSPHVNVDCGYWIHIRYTYVEYRLIKYCCVVVYTRIRMRNEANQTKRGSGWKLLYFISVL